MSSSNRKVVKLSSYRRGRSLNIGIIIFAVFLIYIIYVMVSAFKSTTIAGYEVKIGSLTVENVYEGFAVREEKLYESAGDGYINYYTREGEKLGANHLAYTIDGTGKLAEMMNSGTEDNSLSNEDLSQIRQDCISFSSSFQETQFRGVYDFKHSMESAVLNLASENTLENLSILTSSGVSAAVNLYYAPTSGTVIYSYDGYEDFKVADITAECFDKSLYHKTVLNSNDLLSQGDPAYKMCTSEEWSVVIRVDDAMADELTDAGYVEVRFLKNQYKSWAAVEVLRKADGNYAILSFHTDMRTFCTERFLDIELITEEESGLKIPVSSIVEKEFFLIPEDYVFGSDTDHRFVMKQTYLEDGSISWSSVEISVYEKADGLLYVGEDILGTGDVLQKENSTETYTVSARGTLIGVYNINKGYADFRRITILYQNDEYAIVKSNSLYGLCVYDHIVLDAAGVSDDDFTY